MAVIVLLEGLGPFCSSKALGEHFPPGTKFVASLSSNTYANWAKVQWSIKLACFEILEKNWDGC